MAWALITGASSGIGKEAARELVRRGYDVVLTARRKDRLDELATELESDGAKTLVVPADLGTLSGPSKVFKATTAAKIHVEVLVNNAGLGDTSDFASEPESVQQAMILVNVNALTALTRLYLPAMIEQGKGHVLQVASIVAYLPGPGMAVYFASKAYVLSLTRSLRAELSGTGVTVSALCPPGVRTEFFEVAKSPKSTAQARAMHPLEVARIGIEGMFANKGEIHPNADAFFTSKLAPRIVPTPILARIVRRAIGLRQQE